MGWLRAALAGSLAAAALGPVACLSASGSVEGGALELDAAPPPPLPVLPAPPAPDDAGRDAGRACENDIQGDGLAAHLDCTGLYADFAARTIAPANRFYKPASEFWSDGAVKQRWLYLPPGGAIDVSKLDAWKMPIGTTAWKEFRVDGKLVETRMYRKRSAIAWAHTTYRWNADETDATRLDTGELVARGDGGAPYEVPNAGQCSYCHDNRDDEMLGVDAVGLGLPGAQGITLASLAAEGRLSPAPPATAFAIPDDGTTKAAEAIGFLHTNCGICHAAGGFAGTETGLYLRVLVSQLLADAGSDASAEAGALDVYTSAVCQVAQRGLPDGGPILRIAGGDPSSSLISILSGNRVAPGTEPNATEQMPPIVSRVVPAQGQASLDAWIVALPPCP
jgi:hypothetical protein